VYDYRDLTLYNLTQADNFGSLIQIDPEELKALSIQKGSIWQEQEQNLKEQAKFLSRQYHCVVTNPPYLGGSGMNTQLKKLVEANYPTSKSDLMACFMERCLGFNSKNGKSALINQQSWMFLSSYSALRGYFISNLQLESMIHLGPRTFPEIGGEVVQNTAFIIGNYRPITKCDITRLVEFENAHTKESKFLDSVITRNSHFKYYIDQASFKYIPGNAIVYWLSKKIIKAFSDYEPLGKMIPVKSGMSTTDNPRFLRFWHEVSMSNFARDNSSIAESVNRHEKWYPIRKGGGFRRWIGDNDYVLNWRHNGEEIKNAVVNNPKDPDTKHWSRRIFGTEFFFYPCITWSKISSSKFSARVSDKGSIYTDASNGAFPVKTDIVKYLAFFNSSVFQKYIEVISPTLNFKSGDVSKVPSHPDIAAINEDIINNCIAISRADWNSRENSWDFIQNELVRQKKASVETAFESYSTYWKNQFFNLHDNEEKINREFITLYQFQDELVPSVRFEDVSILQEESKIINGQLIIDRITVSLQFLSYSVGCFFGRFSLDKTGFILANQGETLQNFLKQVSNPSFMPDEDNIIPVLDGEWFNDDIVGRFKVFLKAAFGEEHFEENLKYIEETIGKDIRKYFVKDFYNDHIKRYKKRPIYWMFSSPKGHFKALIYMHRYQPDLCSKMLNDYLQAFISKLEAAKQTQTMLSLREDISAREKTAATKEIDKLELMLKDCREYAKTLFAIATQKISIDLDDGVKVNYQKFKEVLVPIKGLEKEEE
jgi:hypothetical protein